MSKCTCLVSERIASGDDLSKPCPVCEPWVPPAPLTDAEVATLDSEYASASSHNDVRRLIATVRAEKQAVVALVEWVLLHGRIENHIHRHDDTIACRECEVLNRVITLSGVDDSKAQCFSIKGKTR